MASRLSFYPFFSFYHAIFFYLPRFYIFPPDFTSQSRNDRNSFEMNNEIDECILYYLKQRIEWDRKYVWHSATYIIRPKLINYDKMHNAALKIEAKILSKKQQLQSLIELRDLDFNHFKFVSFF